jgi:hypothetical protein
MDRASGKCAERGGEILSLSFRFEVMRWWKRREEDGRAVYIYRQSILGSERQWNFKEHGLQRGRM